MTVTEGNSGTKTAVFTVTLSAASTQTVTVNYATANGTATAGSDYVAQTGNLTFTAGQTSKTISVTVNGDTTVEPNETFVVNLTAPSGATLADAQGQGTITNDDTVVTLPTLSINDVTVTEGNSGTTTATFTVTLSAASASTVTVSFATANGTATAGSDYVAQTGTLSFTAGQTTKTISITVNGDTTVEPNETFVVNLSSPSGATLADAQGQGTITNDDATPPPPAASLCPGSTPWASRSLRSSVTKTAADRVGQRRRRLQPRHQRRRLRRVHPARDVRLRHVSASANGDTDQGYADIDFALYTYPATASSYIYEKGTYRGSFGAYASGDTLRVAVESGVVKYYRNGTLLYTSTQAPTLPLRVDTSLYSTGAAVQDATLSGTLSWTSRRPRRARGLGQRGGSLRLRRAASRRRRPTAWGNAGAASSRGVNGDGYVEFTAPRDARLRHVRPQQRRHRPELRRHRLRLLHLRRRRPAPDLREGHLSRLVRSLRFRGQAEGGGRVRRGQVLPQRHPALHVHPGPHPPAESRHLALLHRRRPSRAPHSRARCSTGRRRARGLGQRRGCLGLGGQHHEDGG